VGVDDQVAVAVVDALQRGPRLDVDEAAGRHVAPLGRVAEVDRQRPIKHDERLVLSRVPVPRSVTCRAGSPAPCGRVSHGCSSGTMTR
jgi:hypothetical protein